MWMIFQDILFREYLKYHTRISKIVKVLWRYFTNTIISGIQSNFVQQKVLTTFARGENSQNCSLLSKLHLWLNKHPQLKCVKLG